MAAVTELATVVGTRAACRALFAPRASHYRQKRAVICPAKSNPRPSPPRRQTIRSNAGISILGIQAP